MAKSYYQPSTRADRSVPRKTFHVLLSEEEREKLVKLSHKWKLSAADTFRKVLSRVRP
jgi:hypothetical protein